MTLMTQDYLGIQIDLNKDKALNQFSIDTLKDRYFWKEKEEDIGETYKYGVSNWFGFGCILAAVTKFYEELEEVSYLEANFKKYKTQVMDLDFVMYLEE